MGIYLLAASARGLFIAMLIIMIVVSLLFGFIVFMLLKPVNKQPEAVDANNVRKMLTRRETQLTVELMNNKDNEAKRTELVNKLRRVKSAEQLVDELVEEEKAIIGATEAEEKDRKIHHEKGESHKPAHKPAVKTEGGAKPEKAAKPAAPKKKTGDAEFKPDADNAVNTADGEKTE